MRRVRRVLGLATVLAVAPSGCALDGDGQLDGVTLVVSSATLIDGTGAEPRANTTVAMRDGVIAAVSPDGEIDVPQGVQVIDASGKYVIPGLVDTHFHFTLGAPIPGRADDNQESLARELYYGVTTILQIGATAGSTDSILALKERRARGQVEAPYVYGTGGHITLPGTHPIYTVFPPAVRAAADSLTASTPMSEPVDLYSLGIGMSFVRTEEAARQAVRERAEGGMDAIKITVESGPTPFGDDHPQMSVEMIQAIVDEASRYGLPVLAHVTSLDELQAALEGGASGAVHATQGIPLPDSALAEHMAALGFTMSPTLSLFSGPTDSQDPFLLATATEEELVALANPEFQARVGLRWTCCATFAQVLANVGMLHDSGVRLAVGTDTGNPYVFPGYSVHRELEFLVEAGLSPMEALVAGTQGAAEMIGAEADFGTIEAGKRADLLILGADPLEQIRNTRSLETVISEGRVVDREGLGLRTRRRR
ncbi:MAG: amidohydrolase family protein [Longimicrobiales bacterium]